MRPALSRNVLLIEKIDFVSVRADVLPLDEDFDWCFSSEFGERAIDNP